MARRAILFYISSYDTSMGTDPDERFARSVRVELSGPRTELSIDAIDLPHLRMRPLGPDPGTLGGD